MEGLLAASLTAADALPATGGTAPAIAAFPFDVYFDVREALTHGRDWLWFLALVMTSIVGRSLVFSSSLWLADGARAPLAVAWGRAARLAALASVVLLPSAALFFAGTAIRYAPFIWAAAISGLVPALILARKAVRLNTGDEPVEGKGVPELFGFLAYGYMVALMGYSVAVLGRESVVLAALLVACLGPVHAVFFLGWREHLRQETFPGGGFLVTAATVVLVGLLGVTSLYDRYVRNPQPVGRASTGGTLLLLGGVDSTSETGALSDFDPRRVGFRDENAVYLSYRGPGQPYSKTDTRGDLSEVAEAVDEQVVSAEDPTFMLGHSQASLILDRLLASGGRGPDRAVIFAPSPIAPPPFDVPTPDAKGAGKPGGDLARIVAGLFDLLGAEPFDIDSEASPVRVGSVEAAGGIPRVSVWALGDSVWLYSDWRRPRETNVVAITDHVGATNNGRAIDVTKRFFDGNQVEGDERSWRGGLASLIGHAFAPWRPD